PGSREGALILRILFCVAQFCRRSRVILRPTNVTTPTNTIPNTRVMAVPSSHDFRPAAARTGPTLRRGDAAEAGRPSSTGERHSRRTRRAGKRSVRSAGKRWLGGGGGGDHNDYVTESPRDFR
ncbi:unnamed protein product, partial [Ixodes pacificus]